MNLDVFLGGDFAVHMLAHADARKLEPSEVCVLVQVAYDASQAPQPLVCYHLVRHKDACRQAEHTGVTYCHVFAVPDNSRYCFETIAGSIACVGVHEPCVERHSLRAVV